MDTNKTPDERDYRILDLLNNSLGLTRSNKIRGFHLKGDVIAFDMYDGRDLEHLCTATDSLTYTLRDCLILYHDFAAHRFNPDVRSLCINLEYFKRIGIDYNKPLCEIWSAK